MIRRARKDDISGINKLLFQVQQIHAEKRSDIFRPGQKKYSDDEILKIINDNTRPVFDALLTNHRAGSMTLQKTPCAVLFSRYQNL